MWNCCADRCRAIQYFSRNALVSAYVEPLHGGTRLNSIHRSLFQQATRGTGGNGNGSYLLRHLHALAVSHRVTIARSELDGATGRAVKRRGYCEENADQAKQLSPKRQCPSLPRHALWYPHILGAPGFGNYHFILTTVRLVQVLRSRSDGCH